MTTGCHHSTATLRAETPQEKGKASEFRSGAPRRLDVTIGGNSPRRSLRAVKAAAVEATRQLRPSHAVKRCFEEFLAIRRSVANNIKYGGGQAIGLVVVQMLWWYAPHVQ
jgi:hypothetical protein